MDKVLLSGLLAPMRAVRRWLIRNSQSLAEACVEAWWNGIVASRAMPQTFRMFLYRFHKGLLLDPPAHVGALCTFEKNRITIGRETFVNRGVRFCGRADISIGSNCAIGYESMFVTVSHDGSHQDRRAAGGVELPIVVGDGVWIGSRVMVLPDSVIEEGCIVAAGAVVRGHCEPHGLYGGIPAKRIKDLPLGRFFYGPGGATSGGDPAAGTAPRG